MSGFLEQKTRFFDTVITQQGRSQIGLGNLRPSFVSFTDMGAVYSLDTIVSGGPDITNRFQLEASNLPQDLITLEADDSGKLVGSFVSGSQVVKVSNGQILSGSRAFSETRLPMSGSQFNSTVDVLLANSIDNFKNQYILASPELFDERYDSFQLSQTGYTFDITDERPIAPTEVKEIDLDNADGLFTDRRLSHIPNFQYLPPRNKKRPGADEALDLGYYINLNQAPILSYDEIKREIAEYEAIGYQRDVTFVETSRENNLLCQIFEASNGQITKLDIIDFGMFPPDEDGKSHHVYFVGKVFTDSDNVTTYCHLMTLVWE
jgi:hypothetical protein